MPFGILAALSLSMTSFAWAVEDGPFVTSREDGSRAVEGSYLQGKLHGSYATWHENGNLKKQGEYREGIVVGFWRQWFEDGKLQSEGSYLDGLEDGLWSYWYATGKPKAHGYYRQGERICAWTHWDAKTGLEAIRMEKKLPDCPEIPPTRVEPDARLESRLAFSLLRFRVGAFAALQLLSGGASYSGFVSWNPEFRLASWFSLGCHAGGGVANRRDGGFFPLFDFGARVVFHDLPFIQGLFVETGAGAQLWLGYSDTFLTLDASLGWRFARPLLRVMDRVFVGYALLPGNGASHQFRLGAGFDLGGLKGER